ncbi:claspin isoform X2 [Eurosta solidaginis]|uniref:claspin isoform X2 n=1 Tax=Eurosta solidaginis TaxID=178769 RepID=UPI0035309BED
MDLSKSDETKKADTPNNMRIRDMENNYHATDYVTAHSSSFDNNKGQIDFSNAMEEEMHLDYDGLSDDNLNDTVNANEKQANESSNDEEIHLNYDGVSDDTFNDSKNSSKGENSLNRDGNCSETIQGVEDKSRQEFDDNKEEIILTQDTECRGGDDNECTNSFVINENEETRSQDTEQKNSLKHDVHEETRLVQDSNSDEKYHRSIQKNKHEIQSQQQRLQREAQFSIPYHKPKKYTLKEFLNRRTIMRPAKITEASSDLDKLRKSRNLKMTKEELEVYSKLMDDRAKEASEFFKAENSDDHNEKTVIESGDDLIEQSNENIATNNESIEQSNTNTNVIITEVLELPKLDLRNVATDLNLKEIVQKSLSPQAKKIFPLDTSGGISSDILKTSPVLNKNVDITIDLFSTEDKTLKSLSRANSLLERLMKANNFRPKPKEDVSLLSPKCSTKSLIEKSDPSSNKKPGETFLQLKGNLKSLILQKRREEVMKKQKEDNDKKRLEDEDEDYDELDDAINEEELDDEVVPTSSENSDSESDVEYAHELDNENGDNVLSMDESQNIPAAQVKSEETDIEQQRIGSEVSFNESHSEHPQSLGAPLPISQIPTTPIANQEEETDQLINLCSGTFETQTVDVITQPATVITQPATVIATEDDIAINNRIISSSDEENSPLSNNKKSRKKRYTKKIKKSKMKLGFSDDEDDDDEDKDDKSDEETDVGNVEEYEPDDNLPATYIDYDSEENEITVELTKEDCLKRAENFVEKEAELSDSEWGSADEDEKNLDQYDIELGDEDEFDKEEVREQLEKIHARKMLDEDIRQVNKLQEILFEDEEDESAKRQRKFRWKNFDTTFNIDISQNPLTDLKPEDGSDDENEHLWRKIRYEREQAIKNNSVNEISLEASTSITTAKSLSDMKNLTILNMSTKSKISQKEEKEKSPFLISKELIKCENIKARSSFLLRNKKALTKTICSVKNGNQDVNTSPDKIGVKAINPSKFVFTTLSLEEHETLKRKADDANAGGIDIKITKRLKSETKKAEYLIDKLL